MATYEVVNSTEESITFRENGTAIVQKKSLLSGIMHRATLEMSFIEYEKWHTKGELIQTALPHLTKEEREFIMTGSTPEEWDATFKDDKDENKSVP